MLAGASHSMVLSVVHAQDGDDTPPMVADTGEVDVPKLVPVMVITVPPTVGPLAGLMLVTAGAAKSKWSQS